MNITLLIVSFGVLAMFSFILVKAYYAVFFFTQSHILTTLILMIALVGIALKIKKVPIP